MANNQINDLRDHFFMALERLSDETITPEQQELEIKKAQAISALGTVVINSAKIEIDFIKATGRLDSESNIFKGIDNSPKLL